MQFGALTSQLIVSPNGLGQSASKCAMWVSVCVCVCVCARTFLKFRLFLFFISFITCVRTCVCVLKTFKYNY